MDFDGIIIGGGHAGIEASLALARLGYTSLLITQSLDAIGRMSCNPAIGGLSKGNIVREIDALGGEMGKLIDATMIQFRILNRRRGPSVQAYRAQADKFAYAALAKATLEQQENLFLFQDTVTGFLLDSDGRNIEGVVTERNRRFTSRVVILTTGTFMEATVFIGDFTASSGRLGEPAAVGLGASLRSMGFTVGRLKTGTPARVAKSSLDFDSMEPQEGDPIMFPFSFSLDAVSRPSIPCYLTYTNDKTHAVIRDNMARSPLYSGKIVGKGPRYCPSLEDKVVKFPQRDRHHIFVEPEGLDTEEMYLNGVSSSLPEDVQEAFLRTVKGLEHVQVMRPGYAVEYDYIDPRQLLPDLQTKAIAGLFVAGQTNGTSGYEEAACQGLVAGINAVRYLQRKEPLILSRAEAYTGVLIDDLVTLGTEEPYRMFTSRAEYRMNLRHDTADIRLLEKGFEAGLQSREQVEKLKIKKSSIAEIKELLDQRYVKKREAEEQREFEGHVGKSFYKLLKSPEIQIETFLDFVPELNRPAEWLKIAELDIKYEGYLARQNRQIKRFEKMEWVKIPPEFDYGAIEGLSNESVEKLKMIRPVSLGQASRISGVRAGDIALLMVVIGG